MKFRGGYITTNMTMRGTNNTIKMRCSDNSSMS